MRPALQAKLDVFTEKIRFLEKNLNTIPDMKRKQLQAIGYQLSSQTNITQTQIDDLIDRSMKKLRC